MLIITRRVLSSTSSIEKTTLKPDSIKSCAADSLSIWLRRQPSVSILTVQTYLILSFTRSRPRDASTDEEFNLKASS